ncbi:hypothetical protein L6452_36365 [Arctium lappa]|uniref:Uncharacterized protein n=1 Tax=Arctium lappa TaxID=4217 RepID=A0ACB8Y9P4_ARCLA|nr:hypothetical protein L6452_36365 [Arctium lappa]
MKEDTSTKLLRAKRRGDLYLMDFKSINKDEKLCLVSSKNEEAWLWHNRFCHLNFQSLDKLVKLDLVRGLPSIKFDRDHLCSACEMGKLKRAAHKTKSNISCTRPLQMLHVDLCGPISVQSLGGKKVQRIRSDNGTEFKNSTIEAYLTTEGISQNFSAARTPQQNGVAEAISTACFTQNRSLIVKRHAQTPYHLLNQRKPNINSGLKLQDEESSDPSRTNDLRHLFEEMFNDDGPSEDDHRASEAEASEDQTGEHKEDNTDQGSKLNQDQDHLQDISEGSTPEQSENTRQGTIEINTSTQNDQSSPVASTNDHLSTTKGDQHQAEHAQEILTKSSNDHLPRMTKWTRSHP